MKNESVKINCNDFREEEIISLTSKKNYTYDIEVEDNHHYLLDNGVISHNSISYIADVSSGIEPVFSLSYIRKIEKLNKEYEQVYITDPVFDEYLDNHHKINKRKILDEIIENEGSCQKIRYLNSREKRIFITARDLSPEDHLEMLAVVSKMTSLSISKTINLPKTATEEDISKVYLQAYKKGIIGVTVYREGSREGILITKDSKKILKTSAPKRPKELECEVHHFIIERRRYYVVVGLLENDPYEVFTGVNHGDDAEIFIPKEIKEGVICKVGRGRYILKTKIGDVIKDYDLTDKYSDDSVDALTRVISTSLRHGTDISFIVHQIEKTKGPLISFTRALSRTLRKYIPDGTVLYGDDCPTCKSRLIRMEGCIKCSNCGYSRCS